MAMRLCFLMTKNKRDFFDAPTTDNMDLFAMGGADWIKPTHHILGNTTIKQAGALVWAKKGGGLRGGFVF